MSSKKNKLYRREKMRKGNLPFVVSCAALLSFGIGGFYPQITLAETDTTAPVIEGAEDKKIYCEERTLRISDENLAKVTVNDLPVTLTSDGYLTVKPSAGIQTITATDKSGNNTTIKIVVNEKHVYVDDICTVCDQANLNNILTPNAFGEHINRGTIKSIHFFNTLSVADNSAWDVSNNKKGGVLAWITTDEDGWNHLNLAANGHIIANEISTQLFKDYSNLESIKGLEYLNTKKITNMNGMFSHCSSLKHLDLTNFDTSNVTDMGYMFCECTSLEELTIDSFDTSNVINMSYLFYDCLNIKELNVDSFNTSNVTTMEWMFGKCENLQELNLSNFDTSQVTNMYCMFAKCSTLKELDLNNFNTSNVTTMATMFAGCSSLQNLNVDNFDTSNVTDMYSIFSGCSKLNNINLEKFSSN